MGVSWVSPPLSKFLTHGSNPPSTEKHLADVCTRVTAHVEFGVMRLIFGVLFDADHGTENRFSIRGLGEARWILSALPGPHRQFSQNAIFERPPKFT